MGWAIVCMPRLVAEACAWAPRCTSKTSLEVSDTVPERAPHVHPTVPVQARAPHAHPARPCAPPTPTTLLARARAPRPPPCSPVRARPTPTILPARARAPRPPCSPVRAPHAQPCSPARLCPRRTPTQPPVRAPHAHSAPPRGRAMPHTYSAPPIVAQSHPAPPCERSPCPLNPSSSTRHARLAHVPCPPTLHAMPTDDHPPTLTLAFVHDMHHPYARHPPRVFLPHPTLNINPFPNDT